MTAAGATAGFWCRATGADAAASDAGSTAQLQGCDSRWCMVTAALAVTMVVAIALVVTVVVTATIVAVLVTVTVLRVAEGGQDTFPAQSMS